MKATFAATLAGPLLIVSAMLSPCLADTGALAYDGFDYFNASPLAGKDGGFGWRNAWSGPLPPAAAVAGPGLTFGPPANPLPVIGNAFAEQSLPGSSTKITRRLETSRFTTLDRDGNVGIWRDGQGTDLWFSFLAEDRNTAVNPGLIWGGLRLSPLSGAVVDGVESLFIGKLANVADQAHYWGFGVNVDATGHADADPSKTQILPAPIVQDQSYLFVAHLVTTETSERISLYLNPSTIDVAPAVADAEILLPSGKFRFFEVDWEVGESGGDFAFDELTFGRDYKSVALTFAPGPRVDAVPEPASAGLLALGALLAAARSGRQPRRR